MSKNKQDEVELKEQNSILQHRSGCPTAIAAECAGAVECEHGYDCCPICDRCTCDDKMEEPLKHA